MFLHEYLRSIPPKYRKKLVNILLERVKGQDIRLYNTYLKVEIKDDKIVLGNDAVNVVITKSELKGG